MKSEQFISLKKVPESGDSPTRSNQPESAESDPVPTLPLLTTQRSSGSDPLIRLPDELVPIQPAEKSLQPNRSRLEKQELIFTRLQLLSEPAKIFEDEKAIKGLSQTFLNVVQPKQTNHMAFVNISLEYRFTELLISLASYVLKGVTGVEGLEKSAEGPNEILKDKQKKSLLVLKICTSISRSYANYSIDFCNKFHEFDGIHLYLQILANPACYRNEKLVRNVLGSLLNLARVYDSYVACWNSKLEPVEIVLGIIEMYRDVGDFKITCCK